jgi:hypothetical protein
MAAGSLQLNDAALINGTTQGSTADAYSDDDIEIVSFSVPHSSTNLHFVKAVTKANVIAFAIQPDPVQDVTIYTNAPSSGAPQDTWLIKAGVWNDWTNKRMVSNPMGGNITDFYFTNTSGTNDATLKLYLLTHI